MSTGPRSTAGSAGLPESQQQQFERELRAAGIRVLSDGQIPRRGVGPVPLSFAQERLWFIDQLDPGSAAYNVAGAVRLGGVLDVAALRAALEGLAARHEVLRTTVEAGAGGEEPVQVVHPPGPVELPVDEVAGLGGGAGEAIAGAEAVRPFDLRTGPLWRARLLRHSATDHTLLLTIHHIVVDAWSLGVMVGELTHLYHCHSTGRPVTLPELPCQYGDYAIWQRGWLTGEPLERQLGYWRSRLAGLPDLTLPTDHPRPAAPSGPGAQRAFQLPAALQQPLAALCQHEGVTVFMVLLAAFQVLLSHYSGQTDIAVGSPIAGRRRPELEHLVGFFVNTLVLRTDLSGSPTFRTLLARVRDTALGAYEHQDLPFERLVEELQPQRTLARTPLIQVMLGLNNAPAAAIDLPGLHVTSDQVNTATATFDLSVTITAGGHPTTPAATPTGPLAGTITYRADLFDPPTIDRLISHYTHLLQTATTNPDQPINTLREAAPEERDRLLFGWNGIEPGGPPGPARPEPTVTELIEAQAGRTPGATALICGQEQITYAELDERANRFAQVLRRNGVGPEQRVGICLSRSPELVAGILGILKAGGCFMPLDPAHPPERLADMIADAQASVTLTEEALLPLLPRDKTRIVQAGQDHDEPPEPAARRPARTAEPANLGYVLYTSGSTGRPKGVAVTRRNMTQLIQAAGSMLGLSAECRVLATSNVAFDAAVLELLGTLCFGGAIVLLDDEAARDQRAIAAAINAGSCTIAQATPSMWRAVLDVGLRRSPGVTFLSAGEALGADLAMRLRALGSRLINVYGPTETTVYAVVGDIDEASQQRPPIGKPLGATFAVVLDERMRLVRQGIVGELYIGGAQVARGYLDRPGLTAERFVPDPWSGARGARLYRTGDLVRWCEGGVLDYLGRTDDQVKIRGCRVEPGEVAAALQRHESVASAVVIALDSAEGTQLVGYIVPVPGAEVGTYLLREHLARLLPAHMVPAALVAIDALPLNANGKLDRSALPAPPAGEPAPASTPPRTPVEEMVAEAMASVLGVPTVGIHDNFFALGGHSLLIARLVSRFLEIFSVELPLRAVFEAPTVAELAVLLQANRGPAAVLPAIARAGPARPVPLSFAQERLWFIDQLDPGSAAYNVAGAVRLGGVLDVAALRAALEGLAARHEVLRTTVEAGAGGEEPVQVVHPPGPVELPVDEVAGLGGGAGEAIAGAEAVRPFDLRTGPLWRARLLRHSATDHTLLLTIHHIVVDAWSLGVMVGELTHLYHCHSTGRPVTLPELPCQYGDYAIWQRGWLTGEPLERQLGYWRSRLAGLPDLTLPTDHPRPAAQSHRGALVSFTIPVPLTAALRQLCRTEGVTLFMALLAAFQALLSRYTGADDVAVGSPIAGRRRPELEHLVGFFVNTLVLRTDLSGSPTFRTLLARVRDTALGAYEHQDLPFERLVEELQPQRTLARTPLIQVMLIVQNAPGTSALQQASEMEGLSFAPFELDQRTAKFDLTLSVQERASDLACELEFASDLFEPATVRRMASHLSALLEAAVSAPDSPVCQLAMLSAAELGHVRRLSRGERADYPRERSVEQLFQAQADRTPDAAALLLAGGGQVTYRELEQRSNRLAHWLRTAGTGPGTVVGICLERSPEFVVSVLAVLKAGGAYLALDPSYPSDRLAFALSDTRPAVVLTSSTLAGRAGQAGIPLFLLDQGGQMLSHLPSHCPELLDGGGRLAYVLYTSGSSGEPKGVLAHHQGVVNRICWMWRQYPFTPDERCCIKTSVAFGDSAAEIFAPLLAGAPSLLMPPDALTDHRLFTELLRSGRVSRITLVPSLLRALLDTQPGLAGYLPALSLVITSGEALPGELAERFFEMLPGRRLLNLYGCSEAAADSSWFEVRAANTPAPVPIGRPLANTQLHVLDPHGQPMPAGLPGELYIGGDGVARGYNERPGLTAERFVPDPFGDVPGARLYRTGDRVRCLPDGTLAFLGRTDTQLKIRGHRIEPSEIESALLRHPEIRQAAVAKRVTGTGDERLIAYLVAGDGHQPSAADLRAFLGTTLPGYMLPAGFSFLTAMPLTPSGKLDRRALPALEAVWRDATAYVPPGSALERLIAAVMADTLDLGQVGLHENFFDLGGHSLLASRLIARLQDMLAVKLPLRGFFAVPTVAGCAATAIELSAGGPRLEQRAEAVLEVASLSDDEVARLLGERQGRADSMSDGPAHD